MTDPFEIDAHFTILEEELTRLNLHDQPHKIWNLDEISVSLDPTKTKVVGGTGLTCTRITAGTGKENMIVLTTVNAAGRKLDLLIVFKGKNVYEDWMAEKNYNYDFELSYVAS
ncbi:hypothetical protein O0L34_g3658 [Tuta absoluta]|nr:hypothetical protein O0L34_g3658 [Tuta absoluta]